MNAYMNITVRVHGAAAQAQIKALQAQIRAMDAQLARANATSANPNGIASARSRKSLMAWGNQLQWTGRQIQYNWTLPLALAGAAATKFALDNEKAMTRVTKVYGDAADATAYYQKNTAAATKVVTDNQKAYNEVLAENPGISREAAAAQVVFRNELDALGEAFETLSSKYGVAQAEVIETAGAWAAAGASGVALAKSVDQSLQAAVLGEMDLAKATEALISIQAQYSLGADELGLALAELNAIENSTAISMQGLIEGFERSAGVAREYGVDVRSLGALLAALVPATGSAATAGNALKTIMSRIMAPTEAARDVMKEFGIEIADGAWQGSTALERLQIVSDHLSNTLKETGNNTKSTADDMYEISDSQRAVAASYLGSNYQVNRFLVLMRELAPAYSNYEKALDATKNPQEAFNRAQKELETVLNSNPKRLEILWYTLQNGMASAIQPLIPYLLYMVDVLRRMMQAFENLDPSTQKFILWALVALALVGPLVKYIGSFVTLVGLLAKPFTLAAAGFGLMAKGMRRTKDDTDKTNRSMLGLIGTMLAWPFTALYGAFVSLGKTIWNFGKSVLGMQALMSVFNLRIASDSAKNRTPGIFSKMWSAIVGIFTAGTTATVGINSAATTALVATTAAGESARVGAVAAGGVARVREESLFAKYINALLRANYTAQFGLAAASSKAMVALDGAEHARRAAMAQALYTYLLGLERAFFAARFGLAAGSSAGMLAIQAGAGATYVHSVRVTQTAAVAATAAGQSSIVALNAGAATASLGIWAAFRKRLLVLMSFVFLKPALIALGYLLSWPWIVAAAVIGGIIYTLRDEIVRGFKSIVSYFSDTNNQIVKSILSAWNALPSGVANALTAVARIVRDAALAIYEWFSYINPFARHSPSLVENVTNGMAKVRSEFANIGSIGKHIKGAYADIKAFGKATAGLIKTQSQLNAAADRKTLGKFAPGAIGEYNALSKRLKQLTADLAVLQPKLDKQQAVVDRWQRSLDRVNNALNNQQYLLDQLSAKQQKYQDLVDEATERLDYFSSVGIEGQQAMSDAIFENEMAQKRLRLEMMRIEQVTGPLDDVRAKIEAINGAQEVLRGTQADLRARGAGSEILQHYQDEIDMLEQQKRAYEDASAPLNDLQNQLDALQRKGEELDLLNSLEFDPLTRQIEQAANAMEELPFDEIMAGVQGAKADIDKYQGSLDAATAAVEAQQKVVDALSQSRDALQNRLDNEQYALGLIKDRYDEVETAINAVESAMNLATQAAEKMSSATAKGAKGAADALSPAQRNFRDAKGGNFAEVGADGMPFRTDWSDESQKIKELTDGWAREASNAFGDINPFSGLKKKWGEFKSWFGGAISGVGQMIGDMFAGAGGGDITAKLSGVLPVLESFWNTIVSLAETAMKVIGELWDMFGPSIISMFENIGEGFSKAWEHVGPELEGLWDEITKLGPAIEGIKNAFLIWAGWMAVKIVPVLSILVNILEHTLGPAIEYAGRIIGNLIQFVKGVLQVVSGFFMLFTGDFEGAFKKMGAGILNILSSTLGAIGNIFMGGLKIAWGIVWGAIEGIFDVFVWLWDELVGHSVVPDIIDGIIFWFKKLVSLVKWVWNTFIVPLLNIFKAAFKLIVAVVKLWWSGITLAWNILTTLAQWMWNNVLLPIVNVVKSLWTNWVQPALALWWSGIMLAWEVLKTVAVWLWNNVLLPIYNRVKGLWDNWIRPALALWWEGIKTAWAALKTAGVWLWNNVLKPIYNRVKGLWDNHVKPAIAYWWTGIKIAWNALKTAGQWIWNNVLNPVFTKVKDLWTKAKASFGAWFEGIKTAWSGLTKLGTWIKDKVMDPVFDKVKAGWQRIKTWLEDNKDFLTKPIKGLVGVVRDAINAIIKGLNKVSDLLPGIKFHIDLIPAFASGGNIPGRRVGSGFKTTGARAIVGEGKANYPEYVIPTDPTHRARATSLLMSAASKIGLFPGGDKSDAKRIASSPKQFQDGIPAYGIGGILDDAWGAVKDTGKALKDKLKDLGKYAIGKIMNPLLNGGEKIVNEQVNYDPLKVPPLLAIKTLRDWVKDSDEDLQKYVEHAKKGGKYEDALKWAKTQQGKPYKWGSSGPDGYDCSGFMSALLNHIQGKPLHVRRGTTATFPWAGFRPGVDPSTFTIGSSKSYAGGVGHMAGTLAGVNVESAGGVGVRIGAAARGYQDTGFTTRAYLKEGGIALARRGPVSAMIGDGRYDEAVVPLPKGWRSLSGVSGDGETHVHIHGDLSFPNITDAGDAEQLIENLKNLAKD